VFLYIVTQYRAKNDAMRAISKRVRLLRYHPLLQTHSEHAQHRPGVSKLFLTIYPFSISTDEHVPLNYRKI